jgi:hypothetical protein
MYRKCFSCGATVLRRDCHKNRYGEYVCRACQGGGARFSLLAGWRYWAVRAPVLILSSISITLLIALVIWALFTSTPTPAP